MLVQARYDHEYSMVIAQEWLFTLSRRVINRWRHLINLLILHRNPQYWAFSPQRHC